MKILQLCKKFPAPVRDGETIAIANLAQALKENGATLSLLAMNTMRHPGNVPEESESNATYVEVSAVQVDNRIKYSGAFLNLFSPKPYHITRLESKAFKKKLQSVLQENTFDLILLETLFLAPYIPLIRKLSNAKIAMRSHNVEHEIWERIASNERNPLKKWYLGHQAAKLKRYEVSVINQYDWLLAISERDMQAFWDMGFKGKGMYFPVGLKTRDYLPDYSCFTDFSTISFIGSLDWMPNIEGLNWFINKIWLPFLDELPGLTFHIAGRNSPSWLYFPKANRVVVHGEVPIAQDFINEHPVMVVPLLSGGGMRVKILEGMALGRVIISTTVGLEGIPAMQGREVLIADTAEDFVECLQFCRNSPEKLLEIGRNARKFVENHFERDLKAKEFLLAVQNGIT